MEWAPVTAATGALGPVIAKLDALLGSEYELRWRTRRDIKFIRSKLKPVHSILWNIWEREELDGASKAFKMEALDLANNIEDAVDDFNNRLVQTNMIKARPFQDFKKRASDVSRRYRGKWKEMEKPAADGSTPAGKPRAYPFIRKDASELVGMAKHRDKLIQHLVGGEDERRPVEVQLKTAFICGTAGMGKTTLADLVYEGIKDKFQSRAFVSVPRPGGNMREVLARILEQVAANSSVLPAGTQASTEEHLIDIISNFLKEKRYLVIIDDIWNWREWEIILKSLPENDLGSRIVMTTHIYVVADSWRWHRMNSMLHVMLPDNEEMREWSNEVYENNIATRMVAVKADLVGEGCDYKHPIVHMCGGTPLAVLCMFSAVVKAREKQGEHAKTCDVQDDIEKHVMENGIQNTPGFEPLVESLQLDYDDLPHHMLKTCLMYCSIYAYGHSFEKDKLLRRWISEGFVYTEEEGNNYYEELLHRGFILQLWLDGNHVKSMRMHPMMRNFLRWKSREDNFIICSSEITPSSKIRRLCICNSPRRSRDATGDPLFELDWCHIRSLVVSEGIERIPFEKLEGLRVLDLCWMKSLVDHHRKHICCLVRLKHLLGLRISELPPEIVRLQCLETFEAEGDGLAPGLAGSFIGNLQQLKILELRDPAITQLPREIGALQQLHTLRIRGTHITELPKETWELQQLKILDISYTAITVLPKEIGRLQQLKTLDISPTKTTVLPKEIGKLRQLENLVMVETNVDKIPREIGALKELKTFRIDYSNSALPLEVCALVEVPECIHQALNKIELAGEMLCLKETILGPARGGLVVGARQMHIPPWIRELCNGLALLDIRICKLEEQGLKTLREMPQLVDLALRFEAVPREPLVISSQGFAKLCSLTIDSRVPRITFQEGAMPEVKWLRFRFQFYAGPPNKDPVGINHLTRLGCVIFECNVDWYRGRDSPCIRPTIDVVRKEAQKCRYPIRFMVCGSDETIYPLEMGQQLEMEQSETDEEEWGG